MFASAETSGRADTKRASICEVRWARSCAMNGGSAEYRSRVLIVFFFFFFFVFLYTSLLFLLVIFFVSWLGTCFRWGGGVRGRGRGKREATVAW